MQFVMRFLEVGRSLSFEGKVLGYVGFEVRCVMARAFVPLALLLVCATGNDRAHVAISCCMK